MKNIRQIVVLGATSAIAQETCKCFAQDGCELYLVARDAAKVETVSKDLQVRGANKIETSLLDLSDSSSHQKLFDQIKSKMPDFDCLLIAYGSLGAQHLAQKDASEALKEINVNFTSVVSLLTIFANYFELRKSGCIAVISSVAGDRGRKSNYIYGASKGGLAIFMQGLRNRLDACGVNVLTIKPGFVDTPMTADIKKGLLFAQASTVGRGIYNAILKQKDILYIPTFWRLIMFVIRSIPERIFKKLSI